MSCNAVKEEKKGQSWISSLDKGWGSNPGHPIYPSLKWIYLATILFDQKTKGSNIKKK